MDTFIILQNVVSLCLAQIGGQCDCKRHVTGRRCDACLSGFYNLRELDPDGCSPCTCDTSGTVDGDITCHPKSGQCKCKAKVVGMCHADVYSHVSMTIGNESLYLIS